MLDGKQAHAAVPPVRQLDCDYLARRLPEERLAHRRGRGDGAVVEGVCADDAVAALASRCQVLEQDSGSDRGRPLRGLARIDDDDARQALLERCDPRLEHHPFFEDGVMLVVVRALAVGAGVTKALGDLDPSAMAQPPVRFSKLFEAVRGDERWRCCSGLASGWGELVLVHGGCSTAISRRAMGQNAHFPRALEKGSTVVLFRLST